MEIYHKIKALFEAQRNEEKASKMAAYMRNQFPFYGLQTPERKAVYKDFLKQEKRKKMVDWALLDRCWEDPYRELQYFVKDYLTAMQPHLTYDNTPQLKRYITTKPWWDTIDGLDRIVGKIAFTDERINALMLQWSKDSNFWVRRIAIDHQLCRKEKTDTRLLEQIIVNNFGSSEFFINKAIGWSLRDYSKSNALWVKEFIERHRDRMNKLSIREASKYID